MADQFRDRALQLIQRRANAERGLGRINTREQLHERNVAEAARKKADGNVFGRMLGGVASSLPAFFASGMNPLALVAGGGAGALAGLAGGQVGQAFDKFAPMVGSSIGMGMAQSGANQTLPQGVGEVPQVVNTGDPYGARWGSQFNDAPQSSSSFGGPMMDAPNAPTIDPIYEAAMRRGWV